MAYVWGPIAACADMKEMYPRLYKLAMMIQEHEGYFPGSRAFRNCNPGNLRSSAFSTSSDGGYAKFDSYFDGLFALLFDLWIKCDGRSSRRIKPESTLFELIEVWAPAEDSNDPAHYARVVAERLGVDVTQRISWFLET